MKIFYNFFKIPNLGHIWSSILSKKSSRYNLFLFVLQKNYSILPPYKYLLKCLDFIVHPRFFIIILSILVTSHSFSVLTVPFFHCLFLLHLSFQQNFNFPSQPLCFKCRSYVLYLLVYLCYIVDNFIIYFSTPLVSFLNLCNLQLKLVEFKT